MKPFAVRSASRTRIEGIGKAEDDRTQALTGANIRGRSMAALRLIVTFNILKALSNLAAWRHLP